MIPDAWQGRRVLVSFERVHWSSALWVNDKWIGVNDSLGTPHVYDLGIPEPGRYTLSVRVDNRYLVDVRRDAHSITDSTQTNWHGLAGRLVLRSTTPVWIDDARVYTDIERKSARIEVTLGNVTGRPARGCCRPPARACRCSGMLTGVRPGWRCPSVTRPDSGTSSIQRCTT
jgi:hypothetical protein